MSWPIVVSLLFFFFIRVWSKLGQSSLCILEQLHSNSIVSSTKDQLNWLFLMSRRFDWLQRPELDAEYCKCSTLRSFTARKSQISRWVGPKKHLPNLYSICKRLLSLKKLSWNFLLTVLVEILSEFALFALVQLYCSS